jgi:hypothetical protein
MMVNVLKIAQILAVLFVAQFVLQVTSFSSGLMINVDRPKPKPTMSLLNGKRKRTFDQKSLDSRERRLIKEYAMMLLEEQVSL